MKLMIVDDYAESRAVIRELIGRYADELTFPAAKKFALRLDELHHNL